MSTKPNEPDRAETPDVVVENLRAAVYASHAELAAQSATEPGRARTPPQGALNRDPRTDPADGPLRSTDAEVSGRMNPMDNKPKTKPAPLPPPSGIPGRPIPTGLRIERWQELLPWEGIWEMLPTSWQNFLNLKKRLSKTES
jgi:hypothetical protein